MKELLLIQSELKAPKNQRNNFGNYNYRSNEDILEAVKPLLVKHNCILTVSDDIVEVGGRVYVKATATIKCGEMQESVTAYAREAETKKGMDDSQITGSSSSYARKYALNGLFLIDDTKDADATNKHEDEKKETQNSQDDDKPRFNDSNFDNLKDAIWDGKVSYATGDEALQAIKAKYKVSKKMQDAVLSYFK